MYITENNTCNIVRNCKAKLIAANEKQNFLNQANILLARRVLKIINEIKNARNFIDKRL